MHEMEEVKWFNSYDTNFEKDVRFDMNQIWCKTPNIFAIVNNANHVVTTGK